MLSTLPSLRHRRERGFTLGEVVTTLGVLGVSLSLAVPSLDQLTRDNRRAGTINELVTTLHLARSEALTRSATIAVCPSADGAHCADLPWQSGWLRFVDTNDNYRADDGEERLGQVAAQAGLAIETEVYETALAFGPTGRVHAPDTGTAGGDFLFCSSTLDPDPRVLVLPALGHPQLAGRRADGQPAECTAD